MSTNRITQEELLSSVIQYEKNKNNAEFVSQLNGSNYLYKFKGSRKEKIVIVMLDSLNFIDLLIHQLEIAKNNILSDTNYTDNIEVFTTAILPDSKITELEKPLITEDLSLTVNDLISLEEQNEFVSLLRKENVSMSEVEIAPAVYDYLAMSNESSDIKNQFFYALLLMDIYRQQPVEERSFIDDSSKKYNKSVLEIQRAIKKIRSDGKITPLQRGNVFSLCDGEQRAIDKSIKDSRATEQQFLMKYNEILDKYQISSDDEILERLKNEYMIKYKGLYDEEQTNGNNKNGVNSDFELFVTEKLGDNSQTFLKDLYNLCDDTDYLDQYALNLSFFNLFCSPKYEEYLRKKNIYIFLDTPVISNYICSKSEFPNDYNLELNNPDYQNALDLFGYQEDNDDKISFVVPHDYLQETIGELKKALQLSWFDQIQDAPIKMETSNIFYNYYCSIINEKKNHEEDVSEFSFEQFVKALGFGEVNPEANTFMKKNITDMRYFLKKMGVETLDIVDGYFDGFDKVKVSYEWELQERCRDNTNLAINADVRQAFYITKEALDNGLENTEYYLVSWDNTLFKLRDIVKDELEIAERTYGIYKPGELADKLAFRNFRISKDNVKREVFTYANNSFNMTDKIRSLFDNVLTPYFASTKNKNSKLVSSLLTMEHSQIDGGAEKELSSRSDKTMFEETFISIVMSLPKYNCTKQNLRDFLVDEKNNDFIITTFKEAFQKKGSGKSIDIADRFCKEIKDYVNVMTDDIKLS